MAILLGLLLVVNLTAPVSAAAPDWSALGDEAVAILADYLRIDTTNPPGNETAAAQFFKRLLDREGIETRLIESAPGRGNLWARLRGTGQSKAIVLLNHLDVVPADARQWSMPPFGGVTKDGALWGRGALDMKGQAVVQLMAMLSLKRQGVALKRDIVFLATADEEMGGRAGVGYLLAQHPELVRDAAVILNEGGTIAIHRGRPVHYAVSVADKLPFGLTITARGRAGHASMPFADSSVNRLVRGVAKLIAWQAPIRVIDPVQRYFATVADLGLPPWRERLADLRAALADPAVAKEFTANAWNNSQVRSTHSVTMLSGATKGNVIPGEATAYVDVRLLPDEDPRAFLDEVKRVLGDPELVVTARRPLTPASSPAEHDLFGVLRDVAAAHHPGLPVVPTLLSGFSDCYHFRALGVPCYGFTPMQITAELWATVHGNDERIPVDVLKEGTRVMVDLIERLATR